MNRLLIVFVSLLLALSVTSAEARGHRHHGYHTQVLDPGCNKIFPCDVSVFSPRAMKFMGVKFGAPVQAKPAAPRVREARPRHVPRHVRTVSNYGAPSPYTSTQILPHPSGCPHRAFCGCGASLHKFGRIIPSLMLAANWLEFPRANPAPGMAAVRKHHVFIIEKVLDNGKVLAYDANSGGHLTRLHVRSLARYTVVNPNRG